VYSISFGDFSTVNSLTSEVCSPCCKPSNPSLLVMGLQQVSCAQDGAEIFDAV